MGSTMTAVLSQQVTSVSEKSTVTANALPLAPCRSSLLTLPLEIRLQIYSYVLESHPAKHAHLSPSTIYPPATSSAFFLAAISVPVALQSSDSQIKGETMPALFPTVSSPVLPSSVSKTLKGSGCGYIPTALLMTCKQVYYEARMFPWEQNEFVFINWFCSGVYAARSFIGAQKPWQRENMRWARMEVLRRDLENTWAATAVDGRSGTGEWNDLCTLWSGDTQTGEGGLWGLRLGIKGRIGDYSISETINGTNTDKQKGLLDIDAQWVTRGLAQMKALKWLEIEIEDEDISQDEKVGFCLDLGQKLSNLSGRKIEVLFVEKLAGDVQPVKQDETNWGEPGDDYIWGVDS